jgi:hypothetical protein
MCYEEVLALPEYLIIAAKKIRHFLKWVQHYLVYLPKSVMVSHTLIPNHQKSGYGLRYSTYEVILAFADKLGFPIGVLRSNSFKTPCSH